MGEIVSIIIGLLGIAGLILTAMKWRQDDTTAVVNQQAMLFDEMRGITDALRTERDELKVALIECMEASNGG